MKNENQDLRNRTKNFALRIIKLYVSLPRLAVAQTLGKQLLRSGTSVGANYREAYRARSNAEFISKLGDCLKELEKTAYCSGIVCRFRNDSPTTLGPPQR
jgi:four helix bundle protein